MKNLNQAESQPLKNHSAAPDQKPAGRLAEIEARGLTAEYPLAEAGGFIAALNIGDTMAPEVPNGSRAVVTRREDMEAASGELVLGFLKTGHLIFGIFHTPAHEPKRGLWQIRFANSKYPPAHYLPEHFHWLYPVESVQILDSRGYLALSKRLDYEINDFSLEDPLKED